MTVTKYNLMSVIILIIIVMIQSYQITVLENRIATTQDCLIQTQDNLLKLHKFLVNTNDAVLHVQKHILNH
jgi:hypothetical protein